MTIRPPARTGKEVSRYTRSPAAECLVLMVLIRLNGTLVPASTTKSPALTCSALGSPSPAGAGAASCAANSPAQKAVAIRGRRNMDNSLTDSSRIQRASGTGLLACRRLEEPLRGYDRPGGLSHWR